MTRLVTALVVALAGALVSCSGSDAQRAETLGKRNEAKAGSDIPFTIGRTYSKPPAESLLLRQTTLSEILERLGDPSMDAEVTVNGVAVRRLTYVHGVGRAVRGSIFASRMLILHFLQNQLVGYMFASSFAEDSTEFEDARAKSLKVGTTTMAEAVSTLGPPSGRRVRPLVKHEDAESLVWATVVQRVGGGPERSRVKVLLVVIDNRGFVSEVQRSDQEVPLVTKPAGR